MFVEQLESTWFGSEILVFHFPGMVQSVKCRVPNQVTERPFRHLTGPLALGVVVPYCVDIGIAMCFQPLVSQYRTFRGEHTDPLRPILLVAKHMADNIQAGLGPLPDAAGRQRMTAHFDAQA